MKAFSIDCFGSHPEDDNDDCWCGFDFDSEDEARTAFSLPLEEIAKLSNSSDRIDFSDVAYLQLVRDTGDKHKGCTVIEPMETRRNPDFKKSHKDNCDDWKREIAHQTGMAFGVQGYNDAMGY